VNPLLTLRSRLGVHATRVVVVSTLAVAFFVLLLVISRSSGGGFELKAEFEDARGLIPGGEVRAGAISVGQVTEVEFNDDFVPEVTMRVSDDFTMYEGATADIRLGSNVGAVNRTIELTQGDTSGPELPEGTVLPAEETEQPVNFDQAIQILNPPTRANIKRLLGGLDSALKGRGKDFDRSLENSSEALNETGNLLAQVNRDGEALRTLVGEGARVVTALASSPEDVGEAAERTALLLQTTGNRQAELARSVQLLGPALARGRETLDALAGATPNLLELVRGLDPAADELGPLARILPDATDSLGPFLAQTRALVEGGPRDLRRFAPIIEAADPVATKLTPAIEKASPLAQEFRVYAPETIGFFQNFGATTGSYDGVGHLITTAAGSAQMLPPSTASNVIGPEDCTAGLLELPYIRYPGTLECQPWVNYEDSFIDFGGGD